jgi:hypothetical protein
MYRMAGRGRTACLTSLLLTLASCVSWHPMTQPMPERKTIWTLRVTLRDSRAVELKKAQLVGDSLIGVLPGPSEARVAFARSAIAGISVARFDAKSALAATGMIAGWAAEGILEVVQRKP